MSPATDVDNSITAYDVICGRGGYTYRHEGNIRLHRLVAENREAYSQAASNKEKRLIAEGIVNRIRHEFGGRFVRKVKKTEEGTEQEVWVDVGDDRATKKVCQALRDGSVEGEYHVPPCDASPTKSVIKNKKRKRCLPKEHVTEEQTRAISIEEGVQRKLLKLQQFVLDFFSKPTSISDFKSETEVVVETGRSVYTEEAPPALPSDVATIASLYFQNWDPISDDEDDQHCSSEDAENLVTDDIAATLIALLPEKQY